MIEYRNSLEGIKCNNLQGFFVGWKCPLTSEQHHEILKNSAFCVLAYDTDKKRVVGFINALSDMTHFAFIPMLEVLPEYQHRGIGSKLLNLMLQELKGITCIDLTCDENMQSFYQKFDMLKSHGMVMRKYL